MAPRIKDAVRFAAEVDHYNEIDRELAEKILHAAVWRTHFNQYNLVGLGNRKGLQSGYFEIVVQCDDNMAKDRVRSELFQLAEEYNDLARRYYDHLMFEGWRNGK